MWSGGGKPGSRKEIMLFSEGRMVSQCGVGGVRLGALGRVSPLWPYETHKVAPVNGLEAKVQNRAV